MSLFTTAPFKLKRHFQKVIPLGIAFLFLPQVAAALTESDIIAAHGLGNCTPMAGSLISEEAMRCIQLNDVLGCDLDPGWFSCPGEAPLLPTVTVPSTPLDPDFGWFPISEPPSLPSSPGSGGIREGSGSGETKEISCEARYEVSLEWCKADKMAYYAEKIKDCRFYSFVPWGGPHAQCTTEKAAVRDSDLAECQRSYQHNIVANCR